MNPSNDPSCRNNPRRVRRVDVDSGVELLYIMIDWLILIDWLTNASTKNAWAAMYAWVYVPRSPAGIDVATNLNSLTKFDWIFNQSKTENSQPQRHVDARTKSQHVGPFIENQNGDTQKDTHCSTVSVGECACSTFWLIDWSTVQSIKSTNPLQVT